MPKTHSGPKELYSPIWSAKILRLRLLRNTAAFDSDGMRLCRCSRCEEFYPATTEYFHKATNRSTGLNSWCVSCHVKIRETQYLENKSHCVGRHINRYVKYEVWIVEKKKVKPGIVPIVVNFYRICLAKTHNKETMMEELDFGVLSQEEALIKSKALSNVTGHPVIHMTEINGAYKRVE